MSRIYSPELSKTLHFGLYTQPKFQKLLLVVFENFYDKIHDFVVNVQTQKLAASKHKTWRSLLQYGRKEEIWYTQHLIIDHYRIRN